MEQAKLKESLPLKDGSRELLRYEFLKQEGLDKHDLIPVAADWSQRRYFRLPHAILMDAPPPGEGTPQFEKVATLLKSTKLSIPEIYAVDHTHGFLLLEDFGDLTYRQALQQGEDEPTLYKEVVMSLAHLHEQSFPKDKAGDIPTYGLELFLEKVNLFLEWAPFSFSKTAKQDFLGLWEEAYNNQPTLPQSLMLRDVMVNNLFWLPERKEFQRCGFIDFQDASWGPLSYDLVSVLEDIRRDDLPPSFIHTIIEGYLKIFPAIPPEEFWDSYFLWGAQRTTRIIGTFYRLVKRDGRELDRAYLPRLWRLLYRHLTSSPLKGLSAWFKAQGILT
jgi:aminoglycoside/choline kinase family phosphotransferase